MKKTAWVLCVLLLLGLLTAACGAPQPSAPGSNGNPPNEETGGNNDNTDEYTSSIGTRKLIRDVTMDIETKEFEPYMQQLQEQITEHLGFVQKSEVEGNSYGDTARRSAKMTVRIPTERLDSFLEKISAMGAVTYKTDSMRDVTLDYVDTESQITALRAEQTRLLELVAQATKLEDILTLNRRLTEVRTQLESAQSRLRTMNDLIAYSTVTLSIQEVERLVEKPDNLWQELGNNLNRAFENIGWFLRGLFVLFVSALPYLLLIAIPVLILLFVIRLAGRKGKNGKRGKPPTLPPTSGV